MAHCRTNSRHRRDRGGDVMVPDRIFPGDPGGFRMEVGTKENVVFLGLQRVPRGPTLVLVNNEWGSTVTYDPERHNIIDMDGYVRFVLGLVAGEVG